ncbi:MAG: Nif11-like leader peptide family RiPP precursor [Longimicrobiales bacterium]
MTTELNRFRAAARERPELLDGLKALTDAEDVASYARQQGFDFSAQELESWAEEQRGDLSEAELSGVAGGAQYVSGSILEFVWYNAFLR